MPSRSLFRTGRQRLDRIRGGVARIIGPEHEGGGEQHRGDDRGGELVAKRDDAAEQRGDERKTRQYRDIEPVHRGKIDRHRVAPNWPPAANMGGSLAQRRASRDTLAGRRARGYKAAPSPAL